MSSEIRKRYFEFHQKMLSRKSISLSPRMEQKLVSDSKVILEFLVQNDVPAWYRGASRFQIDAGQKLFYAIRDDGEQRTTHRVRACLITIGIQPLPPDEDLKMLMHMCRGNDLAFLWFLMEMHYKTPGKQYCYNEQLILSLISHLDMVTTLRELDRVLPAGHPSKRYFENQKKLKEKRDKERQRRIREAKLREKKYESPYFEPLPRMRPYSKKPHIGMPRFAVQFGEYNEYQNPNHVVLNESNRWFAQYKLNEISQSCHKNVSKVFENYLGGIVARMVNGILDGKLKHIFKEMENAKDDSERREKIALCESHIEEQVMKELLKAEKIVQLRDSCLKYMDTDSYKRKMRLTRIKTQLDKDVVSYRKTLHQEERNPEQTDVRIVTKGSYHKLSITDPKGECKYVGPKTVLVCENRCDIKKVKRASSDEEASRKAQEKSNSGTILESVAKKIDTRLLTKDTPYQPDTILICTRDNDIRQMKRLNTDIDNYRVREVAPHSDGLGRKLLPKEVINCYPPDMFPPQKTLKSMKTNNVYSVSKTDKKPKKEKYEQLVANIENLDPNRKSQDSKTKDRNKNIPEMKFYENIVVSREQLSLKTVPNIRKKNRDTRNTNSKGSTGEKNRLSGGIDMDSKFEARKVSIKQTSSKGNSRQSQVPDNEKRLSEKNKTSSSETKDNKIRISKVSYRGSFDEMNKTSNIPTYDSKPHSSLIERQSDYKAVQLDYKTLLENRMNRRSSIPIYDRKGEKMRVSKLISAWENQKNYKSAIESRKAPSIEKFRKSSVTATERISIIKPYDTHSRIPTYKWKRKNIIRSSLPTIELKEVDSKENKPKEKIESKQHKSTENEWKENESNENEHYKILTLKGESCVENNDKITAANKKFRKILGEITNEPANDIRQNSPHVYIKHKPQTSPKSSEQFFKAPEEHKPYEFDYPKIFEYKYVGDKQKLKYKKAFLDALDCDEKMVKKLTDNTPDMIDAANKCGMKTWWDGLAIQREKEAQKQYNSDSYILPNVPKQDFYDCEDKDLMDTMLKESLKFMSANPKFVLASMEDAYKIPVLREWIYQRYGKLYSLKDCIDSYNLSHKIFHTLAKVAVKVPVPSGKDLGENQVLNYDCLEHVVKKVNTIKHQYRKNLSSAVMEQSRIFWFAMQPYTCFSGPPRNQYFSYMPPRVRDINHFRPWNPREFRNAKKYWEMNMMKKRNAAMTLK